MSLPTAFTVLFAVACLSTFAFGANKGWKNARVIAAIVAVLSFILALVTASMTHAK